MAPQDFDPSIPFIWDDGTIEPMGVVMARVRGDGTSSNRLHQPKPLNVHNLGLAAKLKQPLFPKIQRFKSVYNWSKQSLDILTINNFSNFREVRFKNNFWVYIGGPNDGEAAIQSYIEGKFSGIYYNDNNHNKKYEKEFDSKLADIRLYISYDGAYLLQNFDKTTVKDDEIAIFLEVPKDDIFSDNILLIKAGVNAKQYTEEVLKHTWTKDKFVLTENEIIQLLEAIDTGKSFWDQVINKIENYVVDTISDIAITVFSEIADFFGTTIRIEEKRWNINHPQYSLGQIESDIIQFLNDKNKKIDTFLEGKTTIPSWAINIIKTSQRIIKGIIGGIESFTEDIGVVWAFICGLWNGLMDLISGIFALIKLLVDGVKVHHQYSQNKGYYKSLAIEYIDNALQAMVNLDWIAIIKKGLQEFQDLMNYIFIELPVQIWDKASALNPTEIIYYLGYIIFNIVEFLLPPLKIAKLAKAAKLENVVAAFDDMVAGITKVGKQVSKAAEDLAELFFRLVDNFIQILKKGTEDISKFIGDIYQAIKKWIQETFGIGKKVSKTDFDELYKIYGNLISKGKPVIRSQYDTQIKSIINKLEYSSYKNLANNALSKYKKRSNIKNKLDDVAYLMRHKQLTINKMAGKVAEELVDKFLNGKILPPKKAIKIPPKKRRFPDNFHKGTLREVKSGQISMSYKKQIDFDIEVLKKGNITYIGQIIKKIEWHAVNGIDEVVLKYIQTELRSNNIQIEKFQIILY